MNINSPSRRSELDFLRGVAILLVLFRHYLYNDYLYDIGWIGVDLFFVLSGFLVSGLLFKEFKITNSVNYLNFLIRRGFKIYPVFYLFITFTILWKIKIHSPLELRCLVGEIFFLQNYVGNMWSHTWSLAVEEHFYLLLTLLIFSQTS
ncbi:MAG: acyltransferase [Bacteroidetes bacterium]|nr:acyltransferase [Bacteroidota bacterium]